MKTFFLMMFSSFFGFFTGLASGALVASARNAYIEDDPWDEEEEEFWEDYQRNI